MEETRKRKIHIVFLRKKKEITKRNSSILKKIPLLIKRICIHFNRRKIVENEILYDIYAY